MRGPDVVAEGAGVARLELGEPLEDTGKRLLDEVLRIVRAAGLGGEPAVRPAAEARLVAAEEDVGRDSVAGADLLD